jgi:Dolichyl-phosphate-mannose-protein mannosyltransferase
MWTPSRSPIALFAFSRGFVALSAVAAVLVAHPDRAGNDWHGAGVVDVGWPVDIWANWDGTWYAGIAAHGYQRASSTAFFPLYPYLSRALGWVLGGHVVLAAVLVSLAACLGSFVLLHRLAARIAGDDVAARAVLYLALFPTALFLQAAYAESLLLLLVLATFLLAEQGRFEWAGVTCGLALLTRPSAVALLAALLAFAVARDRRRPVARATLLAVGLFCLYPLLLWSVHKGALSFLDAQQHWGRAFTPFGPIIAIGLSVLITLVYALVLVRPPGPSPGLHGFEYLAFSNLVAQLFLVAFIVLLVLVRRHFGVRSPYFVYSLVSVALPLFSPVAGNPLLSMPRFGLVIFPFFIVLAQQAQTRPRLHLAYLTASAPLLAVASVGFALYSWVG